MKLTDTLRHAKRFWWGKGWGEKPRTNTDNYYWKRQWNAHKSRELEVIKQTLPKGVTPVDPNMYIKETYFDEYPERQLSKLCLPWPYSNRPVKGTKDDPSYKETSALVYQRHKRLVEPINLPLNFTNTILEEGLPKRIERFHEQISIDEKSLDIAKRRINWCLRSDSGMRKLVMGREFPYIDQRPPRVFGLTENRKGNHLLLTIQDLANQNCAKMFGVNSDVILQRVSTLNCVLQMERDQKNVLLDLECDFVTLLQNIKPNVHTCLPNFGDNSKIGKQKVASIHPLSWESGFDCKNFYSENTEFIIPDGSAVHTIYLSNNNVRTLSDENYIGRAIMFCYGFAIQQARKKSSIEDIYKIQLDSPINVQCIFACPKDYKIGAIMFQLNSTDPTNKSNLNRVWLMEPISVLDDAELMLKNVITLNSNAVHF